MLTSAVHMLLASFFPSCETISASTGICEVLLPTPWWEAWVVEKVDVSDAIHLGWRSRNAGPEKGVTGEENTISVHHFSVLTGEYVWNWFLPFQAYGNAKAYTE